MPDSTKPLLEQMLTIIKGVQWHLPESNFTRPAHELHPYLLVFGNYTFKISATFPWGITLLKYLPHFPGTNALCNSKSLIAKTNVIENMQNL